MQRRKTGKISIFNSLDVIFNFLMSWVRMLKSSIQVELEDWYQVLKSSQKIDIKTWLDDQSKSNNHHSRNQNEFWED